jgi:hypothetical protein
MDVVLRRLDPNIPDPVESRRSAAGRVVRIAYATIVFGVLAFLLSISAGRCSISAAPELSLPRDTLFRCPMLFRSAK